MQKSIILSKIRQAGVVAVLRGPSVELTLRMVEALMAGGVSGIEITYTTPNAPDVVRTLRQRFGEDFLLGMGTLTEPGQAAEALAAGAQFLVSPACELELGKAMVATGLPVMIGALSPTEVLQAHRMGSDVVKIFPGSLVGPSYIKALKGPFPFIEFMPTGGVSPSNVGEWFAAGVFGVGAGSELCPPAWAKEGRFADITQRAREFIAAMEAARNKK